MKSTKKKHIQDYHMVTISSFREVVQYMYYRFSEFYKRTEGENSPYRLSGFILLCVLLMFNVFSIIYLLEITPFRVDFGFDIPSILFKELRWLGKIVIGGSIAIISSIVLFRLLGKESYSEIYKKFYKEVPKQHRKRKWFIILYIILSILFFILSIYIMEINR